MVHPNVDAHFGRRTNSGVPVVAGPISNLRAKPGVLCHVVIVATSEGVITHVLPQSMFTKTIYVVVFASPRKGRTTSQVVCHRYGRTMGVRFEIAERQIRGRDAGITRFDVTWGREQTKQVRWSECC